jgi:DNA invertase Pin-like site-specific DNA recombinase
MTQNKLKKTASSSRFVRSIRISAFQHSMFKLMPENYPGVLIRMLLDAWFNGELNVLKERYQKLIEHVKEEKRENGKRTGSAPANNSGTGTTTNPTK